MTIGIYKLYNKETNIIYIGQSKNIENRMYFHLKDLGNKHHHNKDLQCDFNNVLSEVKKVYKDNYFYRYIDFNKYVFDKYYSYDVLKEFTYYNESELLEIEDQYILDYRDKHKTYKQLTNKEIKDIYNINTGEINIIKRTPEEMEAHKKEVYEKFKELFYNKAVNITYNNDNLFIGFNPCLSDGLVSILSYIFKDNTTINNTVIKDITINKIKTYHDFFNITNYSIKTALQCLKNNNIISIDNINKLKGETIFNIEIVNKETVIKDICSMLNNIKIKGLIYRYSDILSLDELINSIEYK